MTETETQRQKEIAQAEELLFAGPQALGFAKGLFQGHFVADWVLPYPRIPAAQQTELDKALAEVRQFLDEHLDPVAIDRQADIPRAVINGLGRVGVLGMTAPVEFGGRGFTQMTNCKVLEEIGSRCASTSVFVNAHHSIGIRALLLFGTREQKQKWLPKLVTGEQLGAFALTEKEAGSDAANVQMQARPSEDGSHFILNGEKRYITNAAIAHVLTVMARTPVPGSDKTAITAFLVTPDMPGFTILEARMPKMGIRGTATGRFALRDVKVPKENILGPPGKGLKVALTVLDFGRTTFGACCTGRGQNLFAARGRAREHAQAVQQNAGRISSRKKENRAHRGRCLRHGSDDHDHGIAYRPRIGRLHDRDGHVESLHHRAALGSDQRGVSNLRRLSLLRRSSPGANGARCAHQSDRRRQQRSAHLIHCPGRDARPGHGVQGNLRHDVETIARSGESVDGRNESTRRDYSCARRAGAK